MLLKAQRLTENRECVIGAFYINGANAGFTLELPLLCGGLSNVSGKTCVLPGTYKVERLYSAHMNRMLPHLIDVPGRTEVEIHIGNSAQDVKGCLVLGLDRISDTFIGESKLAFDAFYEQFDKAINDGETVTIEIINPTFVNP